MTEQYIVRGFHVVRGKLEAIPEELTYFPDEVFDFMKNLGGEVATFFTMCSYYHTFGKTRKIEFTSDDLCDLTRKSKRTIQRHLKILEDLRVISYKDGVAKLKKFNKRISEEEAKARVPEYEQSLFERCPEMFRVSEN